MMLRLAYVLTPQGRLSPGRAGQSGNTRDVHEIIPGSTVRGALGSAWWNSPDSAFEPDGDPAHRQQEFDRLFARALSVGPAEPTLDITRGRSPKMVTFTPNSVLRCKYDCGIPPLDRARPLPDPGPCCAQPGGPSQTTAICPVCGRCPSLTPEPDRLGVKAVEGRGWEVRARDDLRSFVVRTALENGTPKEGALFTRGVLEPRTRPGQGAQIRYAGVLLIRDATDPQLQAALSWLRGVQTVRVGGSLGTMGKCRIEFHDLPAQPPVGGLDADVALYLMTPAVLVDRGGKPSLDLPSRVTEAARATGSPDAKVTRYWFRPAIASGWHALAGLPKPQDPAVDAGAVVVVRGLTEAGLERLLEEGIGLRRLEGYGRISLDPAATDWVGGTEGGEGAVPEPSPSPPPGDAEDSATNAASQQPGGEPDVIGNLLAQVPQGERTQVMRRILDAARKSQRMRQSGNDEGMVAMHVTRAMSQPWARGLSGPQRDQIERILLERELTAIIGDLESRTGTTQ